MSKRLRRNSTSRRTPNFLNGVALARSNPATPSDASGVLAATVIDWRGVDPSTVVRVFEDFVAPAGSSLPVPWGTVDVSAAGAPTIDYVDPAGFSGNNGEFTLALATTNEAEDAVLHWGDDTFLGPVSQPFFETRLQIVPDETGGSGELGAGDYVIVGLSSAHAADPDAATLNAWFKITGAPGTDNILWETDDNATDDDDNDTGAAWVDATYFKLAIDVAIDADDTTSLLVKFYVDDEHVGTGTLALGEIIGAAAALQPYIRVHKAAAANNDHAVIIDYVDIAHTRI